MFNDLNGDYTLYIGGSNADSDKRRAIISLVFDDKEITLDKDLSYANPSIQKANIFMLNIILKLKTMKTNSLLLFTLILIFFNILTLHGQNNIDLKQKSNIALLKL